MVYLHSHRRLGYNRTNAWTCSSHTITSRTSDSDPIPELASLGSGLGLEGRRSMGKVDIR